MEKMFMSVTTKKFKITYKIPGSETIHYSNSINANSISEAKNKFKMGNPKYKIIACVKIYG